MMPTKAKKSATSKRASRNGMKIERELDARKHEQRSHHEKVGTKRDDCCGASIPGGADRRLNSALEAMTVQITSATNTNRAMRSDPHARRMLSKSPVPFSRSHAAPKTKYALIATRPTRHGNGRSDNRERYR